MDSDASAAIDINNRAGSGRIRHIEASQSWFQGKGITRDVAFENVGADDNLAGALAREADANAIATRTMMKLWGDQRVLAPALESDASAELEVDGVRRIRRGLA